MLRSLHLRNFKCFDELSLPLAPLTLLTGLNAAGKSTALQTLLLLAQSQRSNSDAPDIRLNGPLVRLGTPGEVLNENGRDKQLGLGVEDDSVRIDWTLVAQDRQQTGSMRIAEIHISKFDDDKTFRGPQSLVRLLPEKDASEAAHRLVRVVGDLIYVSAVRGAALDLFPSPDEANPVHGDVGVQGEYAPWWLDQYLDDEIDEARCNAGDSARTLRRQVNAWASQMFAGAQVNVQRVAKTNLLRLELRTADTEDWRRPSNIGYGLTYAFPLVTAGLIAKKGQVWVVDSPEAHLHPRGQSYMGRFLAQIAAAGVQIVVETHSDHVLNGVRLALRGQVLPANALAVHFFGRRSTEQAQVASPAIDGDGNLSEWPKGFFDQFEHDLARLAGWEE